MEHFGGTTYVLSLMFWHFGTFWRYYCTKFNEASLILSYDFICSGTFWRYCLGHFEIYVQFGLEGTIWVPVKRGYTSASLMEFGVFMVNIYTYVQVGGVARLQNGHGDGAPVRGRQQLAVPFRI